MFTFLMIYTYALIQCSLGCVCSLTCFDSYIMHLSLCCCFPEISEMCARKPSSVSIVKKRCLTFIVLKYVIKIDYGIVIQTFSVRFNFKNSLNESASNGQTHFLIKIITDLKNVCLLMIHLKRASLCERARCGSDVMWKVNAGDARF